MGICKIVKISRKTKGNFYFCRKTWKTQGKFEICDITTNENVFQQFFTIEFLREKFENVLEISGKLREFSFAIMWPPYAPFG